LVLPDILPVNFSGREGIIMARIVGRLTARQVANAKPPKGKDRIVIPDGGNLYLQVTRSDDDHFSRSWLFAYQIDHKRRWMGLGATHTVSLAEARDEARELRRLLLKGVDPLDERRKRQQELIAERSRAITFRQVAEQYLALHLDAFGNAKHRGQWVSTLAAYVFPKIGAMTVADIGPADVLRCVEPIWTTKRETADRVRQRVKKILDYAAEREFRSGENPAASITSLPRTKNGKEHHPALAYADMPAFMAELRERETLPARALEFTILTAARTGEILGATWDEFDLDARVWTMPAGRMKAGKEHRVPLCDRTLDILRGLDRFDERVFAFGRIPMAYLLRAMRPGITVHGFRSSFTDWCHEQTAFPKVVIDMALAHAVGDKVEAAYRRGDLFEKRRRLMEAWAKYVTTTPVPISDKVVALAARG
jgi:integrase